MHAFFPVRPEPGGLHGLSVLHIRPPFQASVPVPDPCGLGKTRARPSEATSALGLTCWQELRRHRAVRSPDVATFKGKAVRMPVLGRGEGRNLSHPLSA